MSANHNVALCQGALPEERHLKQDHQIEEFNPIIIWLLL